MGFDKIDYINEYNKKFYKSYQVRIRKEEAELIAYLDSIHNRNSFFVDALKAKMPNGIYTLKQIRTKIVPILNRYGIFEIYLFGSYARGEATSDSDVDIYCDRGSIKTLLDVEQLHEDLETELEKKVDIVFTTSNASESFLNEIRKDLIKIC